MAEGDDQTHSRLVPIAPMPVCESGTTQLSTQTFNDFTCQNCAKRKVKCDKVTPICSSCRKTKLECLYRAPLPRSRKRKMSDGDYERLERYEHILRQHGLLDVEASASRGETPPEGLISLLWNEFERAEPSALHTTQGRSRYIGSRFWHNFGDQEIQDMLEEEQPEDHDQVLNGSMSDPLTEALMGHSKCLLQYHPTSVEAMFLWETYIDRVEPLCKILHAPSTAEMVARASVASEKVSRTDECLLFAIFYSAVHSMTEDECVAQLSSSRVAAMERYHFATRQALVNAYFLKTTELQILQALVIFLIACAAFYDQNTYWILTGVAVRIAQRLGLHHDGETLGLQPFDVQIRRRLFYRLLPLDANAGQMSGVGLSIISLAWDTQEPLNIDDHQIWPGMTQAPEENKNASEMIFCLSRARMGKYFSKAGKPRKGSDSGSAHFKDYHEVELIVNKAENELEETFIRYCDVINPLHFLTICSIRSGIIAMRLRIRLPKIRSQTATDEEKRKLFQLARKILDNDSGACANVSLTKYRWYTKPFFLWGTWDSLIVVLTILRRNGNILSSSEVDDIWKSLELLFRNHSELLESKRALNVALGRLTLRAWDTQPPSTNNPTPSLITTLRFLQGKVPQKRATRGLDAEPTPVFNIFSGNDGDLPLDSYYENAGFDSTLAFDSEDLDWALWDQLLQTS